MPTSYFNGQTVLGSFFLGGGETPFFCVDQRSRVVEMQLSNLRWGWGLFSCEKCPLHLKM